MKVLFKSYLLCVCALLKWFVFILLMYLATSTKEPFGIERSNNSDVFVCIYAQICSVKSSDKKIP